MQRKWPSVWGLGLVVRLHRLFALLRGCCAFAQVGCADFSLQLHSTSQTFAKFLNAEKMAKCLGTWRSCLRFCAVVVLLHRLFARLRGYCAFAQAGGTDFSLQPHSTSQTFAKFLNAEKMAKCLGTWRIYLQSERTALTSPSGKGLRTGLGARLRGPYIGAHDLTPPNMR